MNSFFNNFITTKVKKESEEKQEKKTVDINERFIKIINILNEDRQRIEKYHREEKEKLEEYYIEERKNTEVQYKKLVEMLMMIQANSYSKKNKNKKYKSK